MHSSSDNTNITIEDSEMIGAASYQYKDSKLRLENMTYLYNSAFYLQGNSTAKVSGSVFKHFMYNNIGAVF